MKNRIFCSMLVMAPLLLACSDTTSSEETLRSHGYSETYVSGYHDGCQSGKRAGGDSFSQRARDETRYGAAGDYKTGWDYGFVTCRDQEAHNEAIAAAIGGAIAGAYGTDHGADGLDAEKMLDGIDTSAIQAAGW